MSGSSLSNWDGSLTDQKHSDADHSSLQGPNSANALGYYGSMSRCHPPYNGIEGTFVTVNDVVQTVPVSGINESQSSRNIYSASYPSYSYLTASPSLPSSWYSPFYPATTQVDPSIYDSQVAMQTTNFPAEDNCFLHNDEEAASFIPQNMSSHAADDVVAITKSNMSASFLSQDPQDSSIQIPEDRLSQSLFTPEPTSPFFLSPLFTPEPTSPSYLSPLFTPSPPPKRRRILMSHVAMPPLSHHQDASRTVTVSRGPREAKAKAVDLIREHQMLRTAYQEEEAQMVNGPYSSSFRPLMIKRKRPQSRTYSSQDEISAVVQPSPSRQAEVSSSPRNRSVLSIEGMSSPPPPRKKRKRDEVLIGVDEYNPCPDVSGRASVIWDLLPKKPMVKSKPSKRMESVRSRTHSVEARMKSVNCRAKTIEESLSPDQEPVMTFSVDYDDTLEHVRPIDAREGIYEYSMQNDNPDTVTEEALSMNLQFVRRRLDGDTVAKDIEWHDPEAESGLGVDVGTSPPPPMSAKARGKQRAVPTVPAEDILLSPAYDIDTNLDNNYVYLEDDHSVSHDPHTGLSEPQVGPAMYFPLVQHFPIHNSATSFPSSTSFQAKEQLLSPLHDSSFQGNSRLQDSTLGLRCHRLEDSELLHNGTIDPSLLSGFEFMDYSSLSSSPWGSPPKNKSLSPSCLPNPPSTPVQIEAEMHPLPSPQCPTVTADQPKFHGMLGESEMSDLTSLEDSSCPYIDPIPLEPPPSPKLKKTFPVKVGPPVRGKRSEWPMMDKESFCHQCRNRSFRASVYCGCGKAYCVRCIKIRWGSIVLSRWVAH
ncbi:uncharacterized protein BT62DRAFT_630204 [Guyanagaster necrorhizus]|uniref:Uncharacterized protein n=1 Tax=Guyanagaster necrorhizus TaxID=856835 RepID=A0A9P7VGW8_9AGAR|nr:uncharacterized protein BT62DRAFT_630204 [Guyanagaster necrorhizus MCA 3950]KAG7440348.1 hypothetical protein BT62DRAFT_630204 [Guyanagaster necrorhizus MCA 3950]